MEGMRIGGKREFHLAQELVRWHEIEEGKFQLEGTLLLTRAGAAEKESSELEGNATCILSWSWRARIMKMSWIWRRGT
jgi:hypothetical protein